jgi:transcription-repair coupling factor (superfamily II helicase)
MRDLELRGAGNILGAEQSGHLEAIGYDLYARMLERSGRELRGEEVPEEWECSVHLARGALIPESYLPDASERLEVYRRLAACGSGREIDELAEELVDRYGRLPEEAGLVFAEARLRLVARAARAALVALDSGRLLVRFFGRPAREAAAKLGRGADMRFPDGETLTLGISPSAAEDIDLLFAWVGDTLGKMARDRT